MVQGKNKKLGKKKGKKVVDPYTKKEWYKVRAPNAFRKKFVGQTLVTRSQGTKLAADGLKGRVFECSLADLQGDEEQAYRNIKLKVEDVQGKNCLTNFWGMNLTTEKLRSMIRKWQSLIEANVDIKTSDGYTLRLFVLAFTSRSQNQIRKTSYATSAQIRKIRARMVETMVKEATSCDLKELVAKFIPDSIAKEIEKSCSSIYPLQHTTIRKVKVLKAPKFDLTKLMEVHDNYANEDVGAPVEAPAAEEAAPAEEVAAE